MSTILQQLQETKTYIQSKVKEQAAIGIILGSGLGNLASEIVSEFEIPYEQIPHFPVSTVEGHKGRLILGTLNGVKVWVMEGRFHFYEGYSPEQVAYPVRVLKLLGVENLILSNAAGGVNIDYEVGDLMIIKDHISLFSINPLIGKNESDLGTRFPDMSEPYALDFIDKNAGITWLKNIYWYLNQYSCVLIRKNDIWFESAIKKIENVWGIIIKERESGYDHRAPKKRTPRKKNIDNTILSTDNNNSSGCLIVISDLELNMF